MYTMYKILCIFSINDITMVLLLIKYQFVKVRMYVISQSTSKVIYN